MRVACLLLVAVAVLGCNRERTILGTWRYSWSGDNSGTVTKEFFADGTYTSSNESSIGSLNAQRSESVQGTYVFAGESLTLIETPTPGVDVGGDGYNRSSLSKNEPRTFTYSHIVLTPNELTLGSPDGVPAGGSPNFTYHR